MAEFKQEENEALNPFSDLMTVDDKTIKSPALPARNDAKNYIDYLKKCRPESEAIDNSRPQSTTGSLYSQISDDECDSAELSKGTIKPSFSFNRMSEVIYTHDSFSRVASPLTIGTYNPKINNFDSCETDLPSHNPWTSYLDSNSSDRKLDIIGGQSEIPNDNHYHQTNPNSHELCQSDSDDNLSVELFTPNDDDKVTINREDASRGVYGISFSTPINQKPTTNLETEKTPKNKFFMKNPLLRKLTFDNPPKPVVVQAHSEDIENSPIISPLAIPSRRLSHTDRTTLAAKEAIKSAKKSLFNKFFKSQNDNYISNPVFGIPLSKVLDRTPDHAKVIFNQCIEYLDMNCNLF
jgi:hypothetical protein